MKIFQILMKTNPSAVGPGRTVSPSGPKAHLPLLSVMAGQEDKESGSGHAEEEKIQALTAAHCICYLPRRTASREWITTTPDHPADRPQTGRPEPQEHRMSPLHAFACLCTHLSVVKSGSPDCGVSPGGTRRIFLLLAVLFQL